MYGNMAKPFRQHYESFLRYAPLSIVGVCLLASVGWIAASDYLTYYLVRGNQNFFMISIAADLAYICFITVFLYVAIRYYLNEIQTVNRRAYETLKQSEQDCRITNHKLNLMTDIAYQDIQNKINSVIAFSDMSRSKTPEQREAFRQKGVQQLKQVLDLIAKTKDYQQMGVERETWVDVQETVKTQWAHVDSPPGVTMSADVHGLRVYTDPVIERVFFNLMSNAIKHGKTTKHISVSVEETDGGAVLRFEDNGIGIAAVHKPHIFERIVGGPGKFHLFFVKECLNLYGMSVEETGEEGKGARFEIRIPWKMCQVA